MSDQQKRDDEKSDRKNKFVFWDYKNGSPGPGFWLFIGLLLLLLAITISFLYYWYFVQDVFPVGHDIPERVIDQAKKQFPNKTLLDIYSCDTTTSKGTFAYTLVVKTRGSQVGDTYYWASNSDKWVSFDNAY